MANRAGFFIVYIRTKTCPKYLLSMKKIILISALIFNYAFAQERISTQSYKKEFEEIRLQETRAHDRLTQLGTNRSLVGRSLPIRR